MFLKLHAKFCSLESKYNTFSMESSRSSVISITNGRRSICSFKSQQLTIICVSMYSASVLIEQQNTEYKIPTPLTFMGLSNKHFIQFCASITNVNTVTFTSEIHLAKVMFSCNMIFMSHIRS